MRAQCAQRKQVYLNDGRDRQVLLPVLPQNLIKYLDVQNVDFLVVIGGHNHHKYDTAEQATLPATAKTQPSQMPSNA